MAFLRKSARSAGNSYCLPLISQIFADFIHNIILSNYLLEIALEALEIALEDSDITISESDIALEDLEITISESEIALEDSEIASEKSVKAFYFPVIERQPAR